MAVINWRMIPKQALSDALRNSSIGCSNLTRQDKATLVSDAKNALTCGNTNLLAHLATETEFRLGAGAWDRVTNKMIVKVQVPLAGNHIRPGRGLVYGRSRQHPAEMALPPEVITVLGDDVKGYFKAEWSDDNGWTIFERVEDQPW